ncbi:hypothetical protein, partial [Actinacidiphila sp. bgisy167]|uniref:hypothetical protein n=1 Tax=Actinacidiphila sp. bgisy167 TaxID=3413797 RepID=UPI003D71E496
LSKRTPGTPAHTRLQTALNTYTTTPPTTETTDTAKTGTVPATELFPQSHPDESTATAPGEAQETQLLKRQSRVSSGPGRLGGARDAYLNPTGLPLGHALVVERPRTGSTIKTDPLTSVAPGTTESTTGKQPQSRSWTRYELPAPDRPTALFGYDISDTGDIHLRDRQHPVLLPADGWLAYGDDFIHTTEGVILRGDTGWIGRIDNWDTLHDSLNHPQATHTVHHDGRTVHLLPHTTSTSTTATRLPLSPTTNPDPTASEKTETQTTPAGERRAFLDAPRPPSMTALTGSPVGQGERGQDVVTTHQPQPPRNRHPAPTDAKSLRTQHHQAAPATAHEQPESVPVQPLRHGPESHRYLLDTSLLPATGTPEYTQHVTTAAALLRNRPTTPAQQKTPPIVSINPENRTDPQATTRAIEYINAITHLPHTPTTIQFDLGNNTTINICQ